MALILVFNEQTRALERYTRTPNQPMPYSLGNTLLVREFGGDLPILWTTRLTMLAWNRLRSFYNRPIIVRQAFVPVTGECLDNRHFYFGLAFRISPNAAGNLEQLHEAAEESGAFSFVGPIEVNSESFVVDNRYLPSLIHITEGLPAVVRGQRNNYVSFTQSALNENGYNLSVDGIFGPLTDAALRDFQLRSFLAEDGIVGRLEWECLFATPCRP